MFRHVTFHIVTRLDDAQPGPSCPECGPPGPEPPSGPSLSSGFSVCAMWQQVRALFEVYLLDHLCYCRKRCNTMQRLNSLKPVQTLYESLRIFMNLYEII